MPGVRTGADGRPLGLNPVVRVTAVLANPSSTPPRVRFPKLDPASHRLAEALRVVSGTEAFGPVPVKLGKTQPKLVRDTLMHRGFVDPLDEERLGALLVKALARLHDLGLIGKAGDAWAATPDGLMTLAHWDDPTSKCVAGRHESHSDDRLARW